MSYVQGDFYVKIEKLVFGKSYDYNTAIPQKESRRQVVSKLKKVIDKTFPYYSNNALLNKVLYNK